ncbi:MAG: PTS sugar transporter subunit IIC [Deltaproteobacteria bacterium]|nr:PTS sugar transporter subunit IIC [Deltaproteobacteria bacterium]
MSAATPAVPSAASRRLQSVADALSNSKHLLAVRDGVVGALPLILVASAFLLVAQPPFPSLQESVNPYLPLILLPFKMLTKVIALYVAFGVGHSLAKRYGVDPLAGGLLSVACLLTSTHPAALAPGADGKPLAGFGLQSELLGPSGIFPALVLSIFAVEIQRFMVARNLVIRLPGGAPEPIVQSFISLLPALVSITSTWLIVHVLGFDVHEVVTTLARPLVTAGDSWFAMVSIALVDSVFWLLGVHPSAVLSVAKPVWFQMLGENQVAAAAGQALPHIAPRETYLAFVWFGGSGGTLAVPFLMWRAKSATLRSIGRAAAVPALFNINEPILFGVPIVMNRRMVVPFIVGPLISVTLTYFALTLGLVERPRLDFPWTLPAPLCAWLTTRGDWKAVVLVLVNIACSALVFWPFIRRYDRELAEKEAAQAAAAPAAPPG